MAKDGTYRGNTPGNTHGAGRKRKALADQIVEGRVDSKVLSLPEIPDLEAVDMPSPREYLSAPQKVGADFKAREIYNETWTWLHERSCTHLINQQLIESYAVSISRWIQCENLISEKGFIAKHPTTGNPMASPYVTIAQNYMRQANAAWFMIFQVVRENCSTTYQGTNPHDDTMERLLQMRLNGREGK